MSLIVCFVAGEGKRSGPNSISHSVIPHPSCQVTQLVQSPLGGGGAGSCSSSPAVPSLPPDLHATGPLETAADPQPTSTSIQTEEQHQNNNNNNNSSNNNNNNRKRKLSGIFPPSPVSSRLRSRINSNGGHTTCCGLDSFCCHCGNQPAANSPMELLTKDPNSNHYSEENFQEMEKRKQLGSDILIELADKISGRKRRKKQLLHQDDLGFLAQFGHHPVVDAPKNGVKKCRDKVVTLPDVVKSRVMDDPASKKLGSKQKTKSAVVVKTIKENGRAVSPRLVSDAIQESRRVGSKSRSPVVPPSSSPVLRWSNGWSWEGASFQSLVHLRNEDVPAVRKCYPAMRHTEGDVVRMRDCILLKSGTKAKDLPFVAKVSALWENSDDGEMMMSLLWYYRPEHTEDGRRATDLDDEIFASRHRDVCSVACIEDKCYVLTFNEYCRCVCVKKIVPVNSKDVLTPSSGQFYNFFFILLLRYRKQAKMTEQGLPHPSGVLMPSLGSETSDYPRRLRLPPPCTAPDRVFLCRKVFDYRQKRILKNPS